MERKTNFLQERDKIRFPAVAGTFYPADKTTLQTMVNGYLQNASVQSHNNIQAVIVPHAGYVFSGNTAAKAFAQIPSSTDYKRIFLLGPSHRAAFNGASVNNVSHYYATPLGRIKVDTETCNQLLQADPVFSYVSQAHEKEHCLEVQLPFLQEHLKTLPPIVPIIIGTQDFEKIERIAHVLQPYFTPDNLFVISSDFSHYPSYEDAEVIDKATGEAILSNSIDTFLNTLSENANKHIYNLYTSACGQCAIAVLLLMMEQRKDLSIKHLAYCNSGDSPHGGKDEVVGYHAFAITEDKPAVSDEKSDSQPFVLTDKEKTTLLRIARESIKNKLNGKNPYICPPEELTDTLKMTCGAFVTLTSKGRLRGCIGNLRGHGPLYNLISQMAIAAAFEDPRFYPLAADEFDDIHIEISVLSPLKRINTIDNIRLGKDGIYIVKGINAGTFLPQVATETGWTKEEFLGHCAHDKAGLTWDGWKTADIYTYQAEVFKEEEE